MGKNRMRFNARGYSYINVQITLYAGVWCARKNIVKTHHIINN